jgi:Tfp pilus assembly protein PilV
MIGDENIQPNEGVSTLSDLAEMMDEDETEMDAPGELDSEESEEPEEVDDEEESEDESSGEPEKIRATIKHDGKDVELELTPEEHVEMLQKSFDYTQKTMALAEERKGVEQAQAKAAETWQQNMTALEQTEDRLQAFVSFMETQVGAPPPIEWAQQDAAYYLAQKQLYEDRKGQLEKALSAVENVRQEAQRKRQAQIGETAAATEKALRDTLPGWNDTMLHEMGEYLGKSGLSAQISPEFFVQKGLWELAHKAKAYDALQAEKAKLKPKNELKKVQKPSQAHTPNRADARQAEALKRHRAAPSLNTLADLMD